MDLFQTIRNIKIKNIMFKRGDLVVVTKDFGDFSDELFLVLNVYEETVEALILFSLEKEVVSRTETWFKRHLLLKT